MDMYYDKGYTTHIPMLLKAVHMTKGPILEIGSGPYSTPLLHWLCAEKNRRLITYEANEEYFNLSRMFKSKNHSIYFVKDWDEVDFGPGHWDVAFIDNERWRRKIEPIRLKDKVDYMVIHDTNRGEYGYDKVWPHFKYIHHWKFCNPWTSVVSNFKNLDSFAHTEPEKISQILSDSGTDKNLNIKRGHCYGKAYDLLFRPFNRMDKLDIVEIGTEHGESLLAWRKFFPNANITGIDIEDKVENKRDDIEYIVSDVKNIVIKRDFDIVIDDGSHKLSDVMYTVENFKLKEGGIMVIEDCQAPGHWFEKIRKSTNYDIETIDMREVNNQHDDFLIVLRNYGFNQ